MLVVVLGQNTSRLLSLSFSAYIRYANSSTATRGLHEASRGDSACEGGALGRREGLTAVAYDDDDGQANSSPPLNCLNL